MVRIRRVSLASTQATEAPLAFPDVESRQVESEDGDEDLEFDEVVQAAGSSERGQAGM